MSDKILFVDDEPAVLDGYKRTLFREFEVDIALGGSQGLAAIETQGPYAIIISDMRMPGMSGSQFLAQVRCKAPDTVRMLLTGYTDVNAAMDAVNEGNIFRFLTKPCEKDRLLQAIAGGLIQYHLITSERELLEKTLMGSIKVLTDVLSAASPEVFGRSMRIARCVDHLIRKFSLSAPWRFEVAATLSQLGCVTLDNELLQHAYTGANLSPEDQARFDAHPAAAMDILSRIPRLEQVAWMIGQQLKPEIPAPIMTPVLLNSVAKELSFGAAMLKLAVARADLKIKLLSDDAVLMHLHARSQEFGRDLVDALSDMEPEIARKELRKVQTARLATGMILDQELRNHQGMLVVARGQEITRALLIKLENFSHAGIIDKDVMALVAV
jgi:ActR/RegA family two-component response regulator